MNAAVEYEEKKAPLDAAVDALNEGQEVQVTPTAADLDNYKVNQNNLDVDKINSALGMSDTPASENSENTQENSQESVENSEPHHEKKKRFIHETERLRKKAYRQAHEIQQKDIENQRLRQALQEAEYKASRAQTYSEDAYEHNLNTQQKHIKDELKRALEEGDADRVVDLQDHLAELHSQRATYKATKDMQAPVYAEPQQHYQQPVAETPSHYEEWLEENPWADQNSPYYDSGLESEATKAAEALKRHLVLSGEPELIGTRGFYNQVAKHIKGQYGVDGSQDVQQQQPESAPRPKSAPRVAPVGMSSGGFAAPLRPQNQTLSREEMDIAIRFDLKGPDGRQLSNFEKINMYRRHKR